MKTIRTIASAVLIAGCGLALRRRVRSFAEIKRADRATPYPGARTAPPRETVTVVADGPIPNVPGKRLVSNIVDYPPGASLGPAPPRPLRFHLRLRPLGRGPEPGR